MKLRRCGVVGRQAAEIECLWPSLLLLCACNFVLRDSAQDRVRFPSGVRSSPAWLWSSADKLLAGRETARRRVVLYIRTGKSRIKDL